MGKTLMILGVQIDPHGPARVEMLPTDPVCSLCGDPLTDDNRAHGGRECWDCFEWMHDGNGEIQSGPSCFEAWKLKQ